MVGFALNSYATNPISPEAIDYEKTMKVDKKVNKIAVRLAKLSQTKAGKWVIKTAIKAKKLLKKVGIDMSDPVEKYLWYAIFGIVGATVIWILFAAIGGPLWRIGWILSSLLYLAAVVSFWYWVYLKFLQ